MVNHTCDTCGKSFKQKGHLEVHKNRKRPCKKDTTIEMLVEQKVQEALAKTALTNVVAAAPAATIQNIGTIRYIGCKQKLLSFVEATVKRCADDINKTRSIYEPCVFFDAFAGTGTVSAYFASKGSNIISCDILQFSSLLTKCMIGIPKSDLKFVNICGGSEMPIVDVFNILNNLPEKTDYITNTYTPLANRKYFTEKNGKMIDAIRSKIDEWLVEGKISKNENDFLLGCLIVAVSRISNTAGTYGAFNKTWDPRSVKQISLSNPFVLNEYRHTVFNADVKTVLAANKCDILYLDPPYNSRQYGSYYHLLETIVRNDKPEVTGVTGLRNWSDTKSQFCVPKKVEDELDSLIRTAQTSYIVMSYNNEGLLKKDTIMKIMGKHGTAVCEEIPYGRYNSRYNGETDKGKESTVIEYIFTLKKREAPVSLENILIMDTSVSLENTLIMDTPAPAPASAPAITAQSWHNTISNVDCIEGMKSLPNESVDLILTDLPYGLTECKWDSVIPLNDLWEQYKRLIKPTGAIVLFGQQPFSSMLVSSNYEMFKYSLVWKKTKPGNFAQAPYRFLCEHEDILVSSYGKVAQNGVPQADLTAHTPE